MNAVNLLIVSLALLTIKMFSVKEETKKTGSEAFEAFLLNSTANEIYLAKNKDINGLNSKILYTIPPENNSIPYRIQAEDYDAMNGVKTELTFDAGGGLNVSSIDDNDWMDYNINVPTSGNYPVDFRLSNINGNSWVELRTANGNALCKVKASNTGGWQNWATVSASVSLSAGKQTIRVYAVKGAFNFNWMDIGNVNVPVTYQPVPGRIEAESYYAMNGVQIESTNDSGGGSVISRIDDNDWLNYNINVPTSNTYPVNFRVASANANGVLELRDASGTVLCNVKVPLTGGLQTWTTVTASIPLNAGNQTLRVYAVRGGFNFNWIEVNNIVINKPSEPIPAAYKAIPGMFEAESYDASSGVKSEPTTDTGGGRNIGMKDDRSWMDYKVNVTAAGSYTFKLRVANKYGRGKIEIRTSSGTVLSSIDVPITGDWQTWTTVGTVANLSAGAQTLRIYAVVGDFNLNWIDVKKGILSTINFPDLADRPTNSSAYGLDITSNNTATPIMVVSSNPSVISVSNAGGTWKATAVGVGTATITASQRGNDTYVAADDVVRTQVVKKGSALTAARKIPINGSRWYQLNNVSNGLEGLFDGVTDADVHTGWGKIFSNFDAYYPLNNGESMSIEYIKFFDGQGSLGDQVMTLSIITEQWQRIPIATFNGSQYMTWVGPDPNKPSTGDSQFETGDAQFKLNTPIKNARYLVLNSYSGYPTEIELYGSYVAGEQTTPVPTKSIQLKNMFGVNAFEWDFEDPNNPLVIDENRWKAAKNFRGVRHYMDWEKLESEEGSYTYNPSHVGGWNYDAIYERCKDEGIEVLACLKTLPGWMLDSYPASERDNENVPVRSGKDFTNPASYREQARVAFQYAARYGSNKNVNPALLSVNTTTRWTNDPANKVKIGLDLIKYIECDNERDKWWKGRKAYQTGREYAANLSAFYDGHKNTMGDGIGVKNADPNMKVVIGGLALATMGTDYVAGMIDWCKQFRGYKANGQVDLCWDVINYHLYPDDANSSQSGKSTRGVAPEISVVPAVANKFLKLAHEAAYDMPVWVTETGYDINQGSPLRAIPIGNKSAVQTQADWILRMALLYARLGIDKVFFYQMYSDNPNSDSQFASQGLINIDKTPTPAATFLSQTNKLIGEYRYKETISTDPVVDRYELDGKSAYVLVVPDEKGRTASYTLDLGNGNGIKTAKLYKPTAGSDNMPSETVEVAKGKVTITVTETPVFVIPSKPGNGNDEDNSNGNSRLAVQSETDVDLSLTSLKIYPNPTADQVAISLSNASNDNVEVTVYDGNLGRVHQQISLPKFTQAFTQKLSVGALPCGLYVFEVKQGNNKAYRKVIKVQ